MPRWMSLVRALAWAALAGTVGCAAPVPETPETAEKGEAPFFEGLGNGHHEVTTRSPLAQRYFDQGLKLAWGFNHAEAERSFREAARLDPGCALCWWGAALVAGPNINAPMDPAAAAGAWEALEKARAAAPKAGEREQAYIAALAARYAEHPPADRKPLDEAYAAAMRDAAARFPDDLDLQVLFVESLLDLRPWDQWTRDGAPQPGTEEAVRTLEAVLARDPDHIGAMHLYIHAVEGSKTPGRAEPYADRLPALAPGAGHLVHMPSHCYFRIGRYHDAVEVNERAEKADDGYLSQCHAQGVYPLAYVPHNSHFGWAAAAMAGEKAAALRLAEATVHRTDLSMQHVEGLTSIQHYSVIPLYAMTRFAMWDEILAQPGPPPDLPYPEGVWRYARGVALARTGRIGEARRELAALSALAKDERVRAVSIWGINGADALLAIGERVLEGEIRLAEKKPDAAVEAFRRAVALEDGLRYDEPPDWHFPVRHSLGFALLQAGRPAEAEAVYREDLAVFPENGWSLRGLVNALEAQKKTAEAAEAAARFEKAWAHADIQISASR